jgi:hypothetical protein
LSRSERTFFVNGKWGKPLAKFFLHLNDNYFEEIFVVQYI